MVTMAVVTVRVLWALSRLLAAVPDSRALREERERDMGGIRTWMSFSSSRSCLFPELDDRFWQTDRQTHTHTNSGYVMFTFSFFYTITYYVIVGLEKHSHNKKKDYVIWLLHFSVGGEWGRKRYFYRPHFS